MNKRERIIDIKALCRCTLEKWRILLLVGVLCAAAMGGKEGYKQDRAYQRVLAAEAAEAAEAANTKAPASQKDQELNLISSRIEEKNQYFTESILGKIDPANEGIATADLIISARPSNVARQAAAAGAEPTAAAAAQAETGEGIAEEAESAPAQTAAADEEGEYNYIRSREFNILTFYQNAALYRSDLTEAAASLGTKPQLLRELITVTDSNKSDSMITIKVIYPTEEGARLILDSILSQVEALHAEAQELYGAHTFAITDEVSATIVDTAMYKWVNNRAQEIVALINSRKTLDKNLASGTTTVKSVAKVSKRSAVEASVKRGLVGLAAGLFGSLALVALYLVLAGIVLSGRELNRQYSLQRIACIPGRKFGSLKGPDKWVASIDSSYYNHPNRTICIQVANANMQTILGPSAADAQIALVGDLPDEYLEKAAAEFTKAAKSGNSRIRYFAIPCGSQTPEGIEAIRNCDAAVLIAKAGRSTYKGVGDVLDTAALLGRDVAGSIVFM